MSSYTFLLIELAKLALASYFRYAALANMSQEQIENMFNAEYKRFKQRPPDALPEI